MAEGGQCPCNGAKKKSGIFKMFGLGKKKKKKVCADSINCPKCLENSLYLNAPTANTSNLTATPYASVPCSDLLQRPPCKRQENDYVELSSDTKEGVNEYAVPVLDQAPLEAIPNHPQHCPCAPCKKKRYDDSLLAMDAQVILQNSLLQNTLSDTAGLVCVIL